jgi:hypothetical protein
MARANAVYATGMAVLGNFSGRNGIVENINSVRSKPHTKVCLAKEFLPSD